VSKQAGDADEIIDRRVDQLVVISLPLTTRSFRNGIIPKKPGYATTRLLITNLPDAKV
jgi:hypothetical protein